MEEGLAGTGQAPRGGPLDDPGIDEPGRLRAKAGGITIRPLDSVDVDAETRRAKAFGSDFQTPPAAGISGASQEPAAGSPQLPGTTAGQDFGGSHNGGSTLPASRSGGFQPGGDDPDQTEPLPPTPGNLLLPGITAGQDFGGSRNGGSPLPQPGGNDPIQPEPLPPTPVNPLPQLVLVVVRTVSSASSRTVEGKAVSEQNATQVGIENTLLDLRAAAAKQGLRLDSDRTLESFALSQLEDADLSLIAEHIGLLNTTVLNGNGSDALIVNARDLLQLGLFTPTRATATVNSVLTGMEDSSIQGLPGADYVALEGLTNLTFTGLGGSDQAYLSFDLLTTALKNSGILLGEGNDTITINSGYLVANQTGLTAQQTSGLSFDLGASPTSAGDGSNWMFSLNARAVGLENSLLDVGGGNDRVSILTTIDADLQNDLGVLYDDPFTRIKLERVGLLDSEVRLGSGDDELRVNGAVIGSTIDLGSGSNTLWLEGEVSGSSRIQMGDGNNTIIINAGLGGKVQGGAGDDRFSLSNLELAGQLDGGAGFDTLAATAADRREVLVISGADRGNLDGLRFENIETVDLGSGNDVVLLDIDGSLTGQLLGGAGLDRLEYSNWKLPVFVDLDRGAATGIAGGRSGFLQGFEQVVGGLGSDTLISSGAFDAIDGGEGDDLLILRWSPWLSSDGVGLQVRGGGGSDLVVFSGLEQQIPAFWDGQSGLPDLVDLDLSPTLAGGIGLSDRIGWLRNEPIAGGDFQESLLELSPSGLDGIGDARLLPIAPLEQLLSGMESDTRQLAIAWDGQFGSQLHLLGSQGIGTSQVLANLPNALSSAGANSLNG